MECDGDDDQCAVCGGSGKTTFDRCPFVVVRHTDQLLVKACNLAAGGILPFTGAWIDQPATLIEALEFLARERDRHDEAAKRRRRELTGG